MDQTLIVLSYPAEAIHFSSPVMNPHSYRSLVQEDQTFSHGVGFAAFACTALRHPAILAHMQLIREIAQCDLKEIQWLIFLVFAFFLVLHTSWRAVRGRRDRNNLAVNAKGLGVSSLQAKNSQVRCDLSQQGNNPRI